VPDIAGLAAAPHYLLSDAAFASGSRSSAAGCRRAGGAVADVLRTRIPLSVKVTIFIKSATAGGRLTLLDDRDIVEQVAPDRPTKRDRLV